MHILVTGATGLIGCHAVARLHGDGHGVRVLVRDASKLSKAIDPFGLSASHVEVVEGALEDAAALRGALEGCDGLLHCAGLFSPDRGDAALLEETNVGGTRRVLEAAAGKRLERIVYVSSILALFPPAGPVMRASDPVARPKEMYASTKATADALARRAQQTLPVTIIYPAAVQGPDDPTFSIGPQLVADALRSGRVLVTEGGLPSTDVRDLAAVIAGVFAGKTELTSLMAPAFYVPHEEYHTMLEALTGRSLSAQRMPGWLLRVMGRLGDFAQRLGASPQLTSEAAQVLTRSVPVDDGEACRMLGRSPITADESFRDLIDWMVRAGHLDAVSAGRIGDQAMAERHAG